MKPRIAYVRPGDLPLANESFRLALEAALPEFEVVTFDLRPRVLADRKLLARLAAAAAPRYGRRMLKDPKTLIFRTATAFTAYRRLALDALADGPWAATIQIQSLFDASLPGVPHLVYTDHTYLTNLDYEFFTSDRWSYHGWVEREPEVYDHATRVLLRSTNVKRSLVERYGVDPAKLDVVYAGANVPVQTPEPDAPWDPYRIVFVGIDWERKGGPQLARAFEEVRRVHPQARLSVVGCTPDLPEGGVAHGRVSKPEVAELLRGGGVFCLPTRLEPFGVAFVEALAAGLPIVGCAVGAVPDMVQPGVNGALVPPGDASALAAALTDLVGDEARQRAQGAQSARLAADRYTWERVGERVRAHILSVLR